MDIKYIQNLTLTRFVCSIISIFTCLVIVILYILLCFQLKFQKSLKKEEETTTFEQTSLSNTESNNEKKVGLGSHYMFLLILSNLFSALTEGSFYIKLFIFDKNLIKDLTYYKEFSVSTFCQSYSFFHNFFELNGVCWTTIITRLFYYSTKIIGLGTHKEQMINSLLFSLGFSIMISILPLFFSGYGFAFTHCSFDKIDDEKKLKSLFFGSILTIFIILNCIYNFVVLLKSHYFYKNKIYQLKEQNENEYETLKIYVMLFKLFPFFLLFSRFIKLVQYLVELIKNLPFTIIIYYFNSILYCLTGLFDSLFCFFFFRGVYKSCCENKDNEFKENENESETKLVSSLYK